jgi:phage terminase large subunit-like protein
LRGGSVATAWNRSMGELFLANQTIIKCYSAEKPGRLRGPQFHFAWCDELASWDSFDAFDMLAFGLRLGERPRCIVTTTPQPKSLIRELVQRDDVEVTRGSTFDNADNLSPATLIALRLKYENTRLGRQELYAEILDDVPGAMWTRKMIDEHRRSEHPALIRVVVAIDPAVTSGEDSDETGLSVCGLGADGDFYVLLDATMRDMPHEWAKVAVGLFHEYRGDRIIGEANNGGDMIESLLRHIDPNLPYLKITATRGKRLRAEPISSLYQQGRVHHVGEHKRLEDQMVTWVPDVADFSPDRLDALVYALTDLADNSSALSYLNAISATCPVCHYPNPKTSTNCHSCGSRLNAA